MATQARVSETEVFEIFRAKLIVFLDKSRRSLDSAGDEVKRMRNWVQQEQNLRWEGELRRRNKKLDQLNQELMSARITANSEAALMLRQAAVNKAKQAVAEAEQKLRMIKKWSMNFDGAVDPMAKRLEGLRQILDNDMPKAIAYLANVQKTLDAYNDMVAPVTSSSPVAAPAATATEVKA